VTYNKDFARDGQRLRVQVKPLGSHRFQVQIGDKTYKVEARLLPDGRVRLHGDGQDHEVAVAQTSGGKATQVRVDGKTWSLESFQADRAVPESAKDGLVEAPMTGTVLRLPVIIGADVKAGDTVLILTAMKMEHRLMAGITGRVMEVHVKEGDTVDQGALLLRIEASA
jgi:biotin carboxyl carrier protein